MCRAPSEATTYCRFSSDRCRYPKGGFAVPVALAAVIAAVSWTTLGLVALLRARPEDIPTVIRALARWGRG